MEQIGPTDPYYVTVLLWLARTAFYAFASAFLLWIGIRVLHLNRPVYRWLLYFHWPGDTRGSYPSVYNGCFSPSDCVQSRKARPVSRRLFPQCYRGYFLVQHPRLADAKDTIPRGKHRANSCGALRVRIFGILWAGTPRCPNNPSRVDIQCDH